jgi:uncharacterized membrane protein
MTAGGPSLARGLAKNRIEALADGIFAVAMTLLVLDIKSPEQRFFASNQALLDYLVGLEHSFVMYAISFFVLGIYWIAHHVLFHFVRGMDRRLLWMDLIFLLLVTTVPFSTDLLGDHGHLILPVVVYGTNLLLLGMLLAAHVAYLVAHRELATATLTGEVAEFMQRELRLYALVPLVSMAVALYHPRLGMYLYLLLIVPAFRSSRMDRAARAAARREEE